MAKNKQNPNWTSAQRARSERDRAQNLKRKAEAQAEADLSPAEREAKRRKREIENRLKSAKEAEEQEKRRVLEGERAKAMSEWTDSIAREEQKLAKEHEDKIAECKARGGSAADLEKVVHKFGEYHPRHIDSITKRRRWQNNGTLYTVVFADTKVYNSGFFSGNVVQGQGYSVNKGGVVEVKKEHLLAAGFKALVAEFDQRIADGDLGLEGDMKPDDEPEILKPKYEDWASRTELSEAQFRKGGTMVVPDEDNCQEIWIPTSYETNKIWGVWTRTNTEEFETCTKELRGLFNTFQDARNHALTLRWYVTQEGPHYRRKLDPDGRGWKPFHDDIALAHHVQYKHVDKEDYFCWYADLDGQNVGCHGAPGSGFKIEVKEMSIVKAGAVPDPGPIKYVQGDGQVYNSEDDSEGSVDHEDVENSDDEIKEEGDSDVVEMKDEEDNGEIAEVKNEADSDGVELKMEMKLEV